MLMVGWLVICIYAVMYYIVYSTVPTASTTGTTLYSLSRTNPNPNPTTMYTTLLRY